MTTSKFYSMSTTREVIQKKLKTGKITADMAQRMSTLFSHILSHSTTVLQADAEAERYFTGVDGRNRPFFSIVLALLIPFIGYAQTTFPGSRWEKCDSLVFQGDSTTLRIYPEQDSVIITDSYGNTTWLTSPTAAITAVSPTTGNQYVAYVFGKYGDSTVIVECFFNPRTRLWGVCITTEGSYMLEGMAVVQPFPPLRPPPAKPVKPVMANR